MFDIEDDAKHHKAERDRLYNELIARGFSKEDLDKLSNLLQMTSGNSLFQVLHCSLKLAMYTTIALLVTSSQRITNKDRQMKTAPY